MNTTFNEGDRVYMLDGAECEYVGAIAGQHVVRPIYEGDSDSDLHGDPQIVDRVFRSPPTEKVNAEFARLHTTLDELRAKVRAIREEEAALMATAKERAALMAQNAATARIADFMAGKITHFVIIHYDRVAITTVAEALDTKEPNERRIGHLKLLTLFGNKDGGFQWRINQYRDGSGIDTKAIPCASLNEALAVAREKLHAIFSDEKNLRHWPDAAKNAEKLGIDVPAHVAAWVREQAAAAARRRFANAEKELTEARAQLATVTATIGDANARP